MFYDKSAANVHPGCISPKKLPVPGDFDVCRCCEVPLVFCVSFSQRCCVHTLRTGIFSRATDVL